MPGRKKMCHQIPPPPPPPPAHQLIPAWLFSFFLFLLVKEVDNVRSSMGTPTLCLEKWPKHLEVGRKGVGPPPPFFWTCATFEAGGGPIKKNPVYATAQHPQPAVKKSFPGPWLYIQRSLKIVLLSMASWNDNSLKRIRVKLSRCKRDTQTH